MGSIEIGFKLKCLLGLVIIDPICQFEMKYLHTKALLKKVLIIFGTKRKTEFDIIFFFLLHVCDHHSF